MGSSSSNDVETVYKFMTAANRPFSGNDVFSNVQRQGVGSKSAVDKALDQLAKENKIVVKLNGKQKIYCAVQRADSTAEEDRKDIRSIDEQLLKTNEALRRVEREYRQSEIEVKTLRGALTDADVQRKVAETEKTVSELEIRLDVLSRKPAESNVQEKDVERTKKDYETATKEYKKRKRMCMDVLDSILENYPKRKKDLFDEIGIETDEAVGMPSL